MVAARQTDAGVHCRWGRQSAEAAFTFECGSSAIALDVHLEDRGVMNKAIHDGEGHRLVTEHGAMP
jgi:hypothetical protein